jgi:hypothetical protein
VATLRILWKRLTSEKGVDAPVTGEMARR